MKRFCLLIFLFVTACNNAARPPASVVEVVADTAVPATHTPIPEPTDTATAVPTNTPTITPTLTNTATPTATSTPTLTPAPKPITHANIGWEGYDTEPRDPFPDEMRIKSEIVEQNQNNQLLNGIPEEEIKIVWYITDDGTVYWQPYFTINISQANNDLFLYIYPITTDANNNLSLFPLPKILDISAIERLGYINNITDIQLIWDDNKNKPVLGIEKNGQRLWYPDELSRVLVSYDQDISAFGLPPKPEPASDFVLTMHIHHIEDAYLFNYDETATTTAGISEPNAGPIYELKDGQWHPVNQSEFLGGGAPQVAFISYDNDGNGFLYIEELANLQTSMEIHQNIHTPLAPAHIVKDEIVSNMNSSDYYYTYASPVWSPDGRHVAFLAEEDNTPFLAVYDVDAQTWQSLVQLPANPELFFAPIWSPDGDWLAYGYRFAGENLYGLKTVSYPEGDIYEVDRGASPQWIQDENGLRLNYENNNGLVMTNPDGSNIEPMQSSVTRESFWSLEDGSALIQGYVPEHNAFLVYLYGQEDGIDKLVYAPLDGSEETVLAELPTENDVYSYSKFMFSPDGKWLLAYRHDIQDRQHEGFYLLNLVTGEGKEEPPDWVYRYIEGWTPDSKGIIKYSSFGVTIYDAETGEIAYYNQVFPMWTVQAIWGNNGILNWPEMP